MPIDRLYRSAWLVSTYQAVLRYEEDLHDERIGDLIAHLKERYIPGGVAALVVGLLQRQEAA